MRRILTTALAAAALAVVPATLTAQSAPAADADREAVMAVLTRLFDGMRQGDSAMVRSVFHPEARLATTGMQNGTPVVRFQPIDGFVQAVGTPHEQPWDERLYNEVVHVDGGLASVWTEYDFHLGTQFSHCGVDAVQLARTADGWRIIALADTRQREGCPDRAAQGAARRGHEGHSGH